MKNNFQVALDDLVEAIKGITLGSIESVVLMAAGNALIDSWNDQPDETVKIDEAWERSKWHSNFD